MKLFDAIKNQGSPFEIPDCSRDDLPEFFKEMGFKVGAEIGVYKGEFTKKFLDVGLKMYGIDPWLNYSDYQNTKGQARVDFLYEHTKRVVAPYPHCTLIRKTSMEAVNDFENESLDFVYIDSNHLLRYIIEDICEWSKKVKKGGIIAGHDYISKLKRRSNIVQVIYAVDAYVAAYNIQNWYVLGREEQITGEKRDRWRSWMWIKNYKEPTSLIDA